MYHKGQRCQLKICKIKNNNASILCPCFSIHIILTTKYKVEGYQEIFPSLYKTRNSSLFLSPITLSPLIIFAEGIQVFHHYIFIEFDHYHCQFGTRDTCFIPSGTSLCLPTSRLIFLSLKSS